MGTLNPRKMADPTDSFFRDGVRFVDGKIVVMSPFFRDPKNQQGVRKKWKSRSNCTDERKESSHYISADEMAALANGGCDPYELRKKTQELGPRLYRMKTETSNRKFDDDMDKKICEALADPNANITFSPFIPEKKDDPDRGGYTFSSREWNSRLKKKAELASEAGILTPEYLTALRKVADAVPQDGRILNGYDTTEVKGWNIDTERKLKETYDRVNDEDISSTDNPVRVKSYKRKDGQKLRPTRAPNLHLHLLPPLHLRNLCLTHRLSRILKTLSSQLLPSSTKEPIASIRLCQAQLSRDLLYPSSMHHVHVSLVLALGTSELLHLRQTVLQVQFMWLPTLEVTELALGHTHAGLPLVQRGSASDYRLSHKFKSSLMIPNTCSSVRLSCGSIIIVAVFLLR